METAPYLKSVKCEFCGEKTVRAVGRRYVCQCGSRWSRGARRGTPERADGATGRWSWDP